MSGPPMVGTRICRGAFLPVAVAALAVLAGGCLPTSPTAEGRSVATLYTVFVGIAVVVGGIVFGLTTWSILRYRARGDATLPTQTKGSLKIEALWTGLPIITIIGLFIGTLLVLGRIDARAAQPGAVLEVGAFRWGWTFSYPDEGVTLTGVSPVGPEAVVPVGEPIHVRIASADVAHAFYVPVFLFKRDAIPGRITDFEFTVETPGTYGGQCAEFCGIGHARMPFTIRAVDRATYDAWLAAQPRRDGASGAPAGSGTPAGSNEPSPAPSLVQVP